MSQELTFLDTPSILTRLKVWVTEDLGFCRHGVAMTHWANSFACDDAKASIPDRAVTGLGQPVATGCLDAALKMLATHPDVIGLGRCFHSE